jgi:hypothetical protein
MSYFVFYNSGEDESWSISGPWSKTDVESQVHAWIELDAEYYDAFPDVSFGSERPRVVILKGAAVLPKSVEVVKEFEVP